MIEEKRLFPIETLRNFYLEEKSLWNSVLKYYVYNKYHIILTIQFLDWQ